MATGKRVAAHKGRRGPMVPDKGTVLTEPVHGLGTDPAAESAGLWRAVKRAREREARSAGLSAAMAEAGVTPKELGDRVGATASCVASWAFGGAPKDQGVWERLAVALGLPEGTFTGSMDAEVDPAEVRALARDGLDVGQAAERLGVPVAAAARSAVLCGSPLAPAPAKARRLAAKWTPAMDTKLLSKAPLLRPAQEGAIARAADACGVTVEEAAERRELIREREGARELPPTRLRELDREIARAVEAGGLGGGAAEAIGRLWDIGPKAVMRRAGELARAR